MKNGVYLTFILAITLLCCNTSTSKKDLAILTPETQIDSTITKRQLQRNGFEKRSVLFVFGTKNTALETKYRTLLETASKAPQQGRFSIATTYKSVSELTAQDKANNVLFIVGTPEDNPLVKEFSKDLPLNFTKNSLRFNQNTYNKKQDIFSLMSYPNPENNTLPFSLITGNDANAVYNFLEKQLEQSGRRRRGFYFQNMDYEIYRNNSKVTMGDFNASWKVDRKVHFDYSSGNDTINKTEHFNIISHQKEMSPSKVSQLATTLETSTTAILEFTNTTELLPKINYHIYKTAEDKGLMLGITEQAHFNTSDFSVHTIINDKYRDNYIQKENDLIIQKVLGTSKSLTLQRGLPVYFTTQWQRNGYKYWVGRLVKSNNTLSLKELFDNTLIENESGLVVDCMSAILVDFLLKTWGKSIFLERYNTWQPTVIEIKQLEIGWKTHLKTIADNIPIAIKRKPYISYLKGFNFAHEGYGIYNGYLSRKATESLTKQKNMGANAVTIVPYSYIRNSGDTDPTYLSLNKSARSENDQGVIHSAYEAKQLGMSTLLKPQVFVGRGWSGDMEFKTEAQWQKFFKYYYKWIRHYAFLAEIHDIEMFAVGVEFSKAMLTHQEEWEKMIKNLRGLYSGQMTYCANWGKEFETVSLWNELDFIGINSYYPLSDKNNATDEELNATFEDVKTKIKSVYNTYKKPIVFTEIGFRSLNAPWKLPYSDGDNNIFNEEHQDRAYKVIFNGIKDEEWCRGILWWKFPSYLEYRGRENTSFTPNNKKAEATVRKWFSL
ncbi:glycoside hydrolase family 113 [Winogradskyella immobilis]|uniref:Uncharacterized protein n=1 Tax=Winogradskyella immobilis TaxID=2816852 RepID=A0ABS8EQB5_9FLAO|nr:glycosyl hydrolase [Winogradskyella immobilis]MCC1485368.1 hypothetical protein [Winogradskyella immobilis]MCG0017460.1 hypothetical protein [Winogradskyella immobilis]